MAGTPMAATARVVHPASTGAKQPTVAELKKTESKIPSLHLPTHQLCWWVGSDRRGVGVY
eukprot:2448272-Amphidinium_carterae.1